MQATSFKPQYVATCYLKALYKENCFPTYLKGVGRVRVGSGHQWAIHPLNGAERDQLGENYPMEAARGSCKWRLQSWESSKAGGSLSGTVAEWPRGD